MLRWRKSITPLLPATFAVLIAQSVPAYFKTTPLAESKRHDCSPSLLGVKRGRFNPVVPRLYSVQGEGIFKIILPKLLPIASIAACIES